jgi:hypothetical protein
MLKSPGTSDASLDVVRTHDVTMTPVTDQIHLSEGSYILRKDDHVLVTL